MSQIRGDIMEPAVESEATLEIYPETDIINEKLEWFQDQKIGVIFHWGLYAEAGIVESWQLSETDDWARRKGAWRDNMEDLQRDYWNLIDDFNPEAFQPEEWARICKDAGFRYMIFTTKHHDGFHMWDTAQSDYKVCSDRSPVKKDLYGEVVAAFRNEGFGIGAYYSKADWFSPYYWSSPDTIKSRRTDYDPEENPELWEKYVTFVHHELEEITQNYGHVDILWLDAGWCGKGKEELRMDEIAEKVRKTNPDLLMVDRMRGGRHENYVTPERRIPELNEIPKKVWESNIPLAKNWGYCPNDIYKSSQEIIQNVVDVVSKGGNIILGVGPDAHGQFTEEAKIILNDLGQWLKANGEGIYGTRAIQSLGGLEHWRMTHKGNVYYGFGISLESGTLMFPKENLEGKQAVSMAFLDSKEEIVFTEAESHYVISIPNRHFPWEIIPIKIETV